jgi:hypothetical protein
MQSVTHLKGECSVENPKVLSGLYSEAVGGEGGGAASAVGPRNFWENAMPTAAQATDVAARITLPSMVDLFGRC